jgi:hypothetical protein
MPVTTTRLLDALGASARDYDTAVFAPAGTGTVASVAELEPLFPKQ